MIAKRGKALKINERNDHKYDRKMDNLRKGN